MNLLVLALFHIQASGTLIELQSLKTTIQILGIYQEIWQQCYKEIWPIYLKIQIVYVDYSLKKFLDLTMHSLLDREKLKNQLR